jgi:hypothetical protein
MRPETQRHSIKKMSFILNALLLSKIVHLLINLKKGFGNFALNFRFHSFAAEFSHCTTEKNFSS